MNQAEREKVGTSFITLNYHLKKKIQIQLNGSSLTILLIH